jgi:transposase InsO family protein
MKANLMSPRARKSCHFLEDVTLRPKPGDLFLQGCNLGQIGPHLPVPGEGCGRGCGQFPHPATQHALRHVEVTGRLRYRYVTVRHQSNSLDLELTAELPSRHICTPVPWSRSYLRVHETGSSSRFALHSKETKIFARQLGLKPCFTPIQSLQSNCISEAFVKTLKRDYVQVTPLPDAQTVLGLIGGWIEDYNKNHPHSGLKMRSPREFIAAQTATA